MPFPVLRIQIRVDLHYFAPSDFKNDRIREKKSDPDQETDKLANLLPQCCCNRMHIICGKNVHIAKKQLYDLYFI